jgi:hypothetical protein
MLSYLSHCNAPQEGHNLFGSQPSALEPCSFVSTRELAGRARGLPFDIGSPESQASLPLRRRGGEEDGVEPL